MHSDRLSLKAVFSDSRFEHKRDECSGKLAHAGPLWIGGLYDESFLKNAGNALENLQETLHKKVPSMLSKMTEEAEIQNCMYIDLHALCDLHGLSPPKNISVIEELMNRGFKAVRTSFRPTAIRTEASVKEVVDVIAQLVGAE
jgi:tRNA G26 N,N-dimethylase Trm1